MSRLIFFECLLVIAMTSGALGIMVPTGKETPITPAKPTPKPIYHKTPPPAAPVVEYTEENPEPPPLDPSYVPVTYKYINALIAHGHYYVPVQFKMPVYRSQPVPSNNDVDPAENDVEPPQAPSKYVKNVGKFLKKPIYYVPATYQYNVPTKGGYPKKAVAQPSEKQYWYTLNRRNYY